ncbi:hypothetical protein GCM10023210_26990 [Chryseobacterium ginsengisoli]|uniref:Uncharacterized protein n=1 Tax=Chryseobacterium ginsengisoli TaxID=363853 RepID=A0ABP9MDV1_9FLAO
MKELVIFFNLITILMSCSKSTTDTKTNKNDTINTMYYVNYNFSFPYEISINDVLLEKDVFNGRSGPDRLNNYILNSGRQKISIKVFAPKDYNNGLLKDKDLQILSEQSALYKVNNSDKSYNLIKRLKFSPIPKDLPFYEQEWEFDANVPNEIIGWKNSKDLTKLDKEELQEKVQKKFQELYNQLNEGKVGNFLDEIQVSSNEFFKTNYFNKSQEIEYTDNLKNSYSNFKGKMIPYNKGILRIMGNGKTVTLEIPDGKYRGMGVLIAEDREKQNVYYNTVILHIPQGAEEVKVIRINSIGGKLPK